MEYYEGKPLQATIDRLRTVLSHPPLEIIASALLPLTEWDASIKKLFTAYDGFVGVLADDAKRKHLDELPVEEIEGDAIAAESRGLSHDFRDAIAELFLTKETELGRLTLEYGVF